MKNKNINSLGKDSLTFVPDKISTIIHGGHIIRTGRKIVDRAKIGTVETKSRPSEKEPNQYSGHSYKNKMERFRLDGHKLIYHADRVIAWLKGQRIAPIHIDMGLTKFCNMGCIYCIGVTQGMAKAVMIQPSALLRLIDDCGRLGVRSISFIGDGEPTLNPAMYEALISAKNFGIDVGIGTNGLLIDMDRCDAILKNATFIRINLSCAEAKVFEKIHQSKAENFNVIVEKIKGLVKRKREKKYNCTIGIQMVLIPENFNQVLKLGLLAKELGADYLQIKQCSDTEYRELGINPRDYIKAEKDLKEAEKLSNADYFVKVKWNKINIINDTDVYKQGFRKYDICYGTPFLGQISGNGRVYPCGPFFAKERFCMGDIHKQSYYDIVQSDRYWQVHRDIIENVDVHYDCTVGCRQDYINKFLWDLKNPPEHINFI
jgi:MoaA/NifB/PqqE/SkfB family radical SAM enzyme